VEWLLLSCAFPPQRSTPRVALWRRLRRNGAVAPKAGLYLLPSREGCLEAAQWIAQEARAEGGEPLLIHAAAIDGMSEADLVALFHAARREDYAELEARLAELEGRAETVDDAVPPALARLRADLQAIQRIDYFDTPEGLQVQSRLDALAGLLAGDAGVSAIPRLRIEDYRGRTWTTRPRPFVDRLACAWLIRRFIDADATIRYADQPDRDEVGFDLVGGTFEHVGARCTFEVMVEAFELRGDAGLRGLGEIVHEIDLHDGRYPRVEAPGVESVLLGWSAGADPDEVIERRAAVLFDGLYRSLAVGVTPA